MLISDRIKSVQESAELVSLKCVKLVDILSGTPSVGTLKTSDFPCPFSAILQSILQTRTSAIVVLSPDEIPVGVITVRDVWHYVMQGSSVQTS